MSENEPITAVSPTHSELEALRTRVHELEAQVQAMEGRLPNTWLLSDNILKRAFGVYGHYLLAGLLIAVPIMLCSFFTIFVLGMIGAIFGGDYGY